MGKGISQKEEMLKKKKEKEGHFITRVRHRTSASPYILLSEIISFCLLN
jgi:hypothetical protein